MYSFDFEKNTFILKKTKNYCKDNNSKFFCYLKRNNKFIIFNCDELVIYDSLLTKNKTMLSFEYNGCQREFIRSCKELKSNLLCVVLSCSISLYNSDIEKLIGNFTVINPTCIKLIECHGGNKYLAVLSLGEINLFEIEKLTFVMKLNTNNLKNIQKIKQLPNLNIAIIYGEFNLAIYDIKKNIINYQIKNETKINHYIKHFILKNINDNILIYNPKGYCLHFIDYKKGQVLAKFSDGLNKIQKCKKINDTTLYTNENEKINENIKCFFIINVKGYFLIKINNI